MSHPMLPLSMEHSSQTSQQEHSLYKTDKPFKFNFYIFLRINFIVFTILIIIWCNKAEGGFNTTANLFSWHSLGMTLAFPVCMTEAILSCKNVYKHIFFNVLTIIFTIFALIAIVYYKHLEIDYTGDMSMGDMSTNGTFPFENMYTVHSWLGVLTLVLFVTQPFLSKYYIHKINGKIVYIVGLVTCITGLADMQLTDLAGNGYPTYSTESLLAPGAALVLISLGTAYYIKFI